MRKITFLMFMVSLLMPLSLGAQGLQGLQTKVRSLNVEAGKGDRVKANNGLVSRSNGLVPKAIPVQQSLKSKRIAPAEDGSYTWDFEDVSQFEEWTLVDNDGDGMNWEYFNNSGEGLKMTAHGGDGLVASASYDSETSKALNPDNYLISPEVNLGGVLTLWACGQDKSFSDEVFGIYVYVGQFDGSVSRFRQVGADVTVTGTMTKYEFDLSRYAGRTGHFAIRHYNVSDMYWLNIDDVTLNPGQVYVPDPTVPTDLTATPGATTADVEWIDTDDSSWNLRYREYLPDARKTLFWDFEEDADFENWSIYDYDGDGDNWGVTTSLGHNNSTCLYSLSYYDGEIFDPDNWLISPEVKLGGTLSLWARSYSANWPDNFGVFLLLDTGDMVQVGEDQAPSDTWTEYTYDLSEYEGYEGQFIIRHYDSYNNYILLIDDITLEIPGVEPAEWIDVTDLDETNYTIEGLTPGVQYEVQVQATNAEKISDWSESEIFTTILELALLNDDSSQEEGAKNSDLLAANMGKFVQMTLADRTFFTDGEWNSLFLPFSLTEEQIAASPLKGATIMELYDALVTGTHVDLSFVQVDEIDAGWYYIFKWDDEDGELDDIVNPLFKDVKIVMDDPYQIIGVSDGSFEVGGNFDSYLADPEEDGCYTYYFGAGSKLRYSTTPRWLKSCRIFFRFFNVSDPSAVSFNLGFEDGDSVTGITEQEGGSVKTRSTDGYFNVQGMKLNGKPLQKGVYINNGKKVVIK